MSSSSPSSWSSQPSTVAPLRAVLAAALALGAHGHGAVTFPKPRNSLDGALAPWTQWAYPCDANHSGVDCAISFCEDGHLCQGSCPISTHNGLPGTLNASNGQRYVAGLVGGGGGEG
jgi:hypothetical protein